MNTATGAAGPFPSAVVWDLDGTLTESAPDLATALNTLLSEHGLKPRKVDDVRVMIGHGVQKLVERGFRAAGSPVGKAELDALVLHFVDIYQSCATDSTCLIPGARYALDRLHRAGVAQGLCTNKPAGITRKLIGALGVSAYFGSVVGGDSTAARKPDPLPLLTCLSELGVAPSHAVMVGDSGADVGAARAAGVPVILVPDGYTGAPVSSLGADLVADSLLDIPECLAANYALRRSA